MSDDIKCTKKRKKNAVVGMLNVNLIQEICTKSVYRRAKRKEKIEELRVSDSGPKRLQNH